MPHMLRKPLCGEALGNEIGDRSKTPVVDQNVLPGLLVYTASERRSLLSLSLGRVTLFLLVGLASGASCGGRRKKGENSD
jgi:hypothetical protein